MVRGVYASKLLICNCSGCGGGKVKCILNVCKYFALLSSSCLASGQGEVISGKCSEKTTANWTPWCPSLVTRSPLSFCGATTWTLNCGEGDSVSLGMEVFSNCQVSDASLTRQNHRFLFSKRQGCFCSCSYHFEGISLQASLHLLSLASPAPQLRSGGSWEHKTSWRSPSPISPNRHLLLEPFLNG